MRPGRPSFDCRSPRPARSRRRARCGPDAARTPPPACGPALICTWAGNGEPAFYGDGLDRREAMLYWPMDLAFAPDGRAYVLDWQNHRVRRVNADDKFETVLGTGDVGDGPDTGDERTRARRGGHATAT